MSRDETKNDWGKGIITLSGNVQNVCHVHDIKGEKNNPVNRKHCCRTPSLKPKEYSSIREKNDMRTRNK